MLKNYLKIALRNLLKYKLYAFINVTGLAVGIASCILILLFVQDEYTFDGYHSQADQLYRARVQETYEGEVFQNTVTPFILGPTLEAEIPEVDQMSRNVSFTDLVKHGTFQESETITLLDPAFFEMFDVPWSEGSAAHFGTDLHQVLLTPTAAEKYFGQGSPMGKTLSIRLGEEFQDFVVEGVLKPHPSNSSFSFDFVIPFANAKNLFRERAMTSWFNIFVETYVTLESGVDTTGLYATKFPAMMKKALGDEYEEGNYLVRLQPFTDIHFNRDLPPGILPVSDSRYSFILAAIALLVLLVACINFTTLAVSRSLSRAREVSVRKVVGASRPQLIGQFMSEAIVIALLALVLGVFLADLCLPVFNQLAQKRLTLQFSVTNVATWLGLALMIGVMSGSYPAFFLSALSPIKSEDNAQQGKNLLLKGLVGIQFALSITLITCTFILGDQVDYMRNKNLGFDKEHCVTLPYTASPSPGVGLTAIYEEGIETTKRLAQELSQDPTIQGITSSSYGLHETGWMQLGHTEEDGQFRRITVNAVDEDFLKVMGMEMVKGRFFDKNISSDETRAAIVNETMVKTYGWETPIGQTLPKPWNEIQVIGVIKDFHFASLHNPIDPLVLVVNPIPMLQLANDVNWNRYPSPVPTVRIKSSEVSESLKRIETAWEKAVPNHPFSYTFVDQAVDAMYRQEARMSRILNIAAVLAIFVACLGLFGIVAISVAKRTKEIGIRKVLGAEAGDIVLLLSKSFIVLICLSMAVAFGVTWYFAEEWLGLDEFAFRIGLSPWSFVLGGGITLGVAVLTLVYQALRAARANPVESLRSE